AQPDAVARIFSVKGRPSDHPLIVHVSSADALDALSPRVPAFARALADAFWPGPLTLILPRSERVPDSVTGGQDTVGVRVPSHPVARQLLAAFEERGGLGVAAPSANRFGRVSPTTAAAVRAELAAYLSDADVVLDGDQSAVGIESTIVDCTGERPVVLRPGAVTAADIMKATGLTLGERSKPIRVSGSLESHYAPTAAVVLDVAPQPGDGLIALAAVPTPEGVIRLAAPESAEAYAHDLYQALRAADDLGLERVVAVVPEGDGIALALRDRLSRAAHPLRS
ncbi:MAG TPA: L-threonylcarbamoyladenylate synthase, partial [Microbacteriaceae bacterium]|nr:L-threonylcarbamoyladenylate synthase [Microbacteriaceae bacterium]